MSRFYIACENMKLIFRDSEVRKVIEMYGSNDVWQISKKLKRDPDEIAVLIIDLAKEGKLDEAS